MVKKNKGISGILTNKWGWVGAVIYSLFVYTFLSSSSKFAIFLSYPLYPFMYVVRLLFPCSGEGCFVLGIATIFILVPIVGFILGLILQKLWRKLR